MRCACFGSLRSSRGVASAVDGGSWECPSDSRNASTEGLSVVRTVSSSEFIVLRVDCSVVEVGVVEGIPLELVAEGPTMGGSFVPMIAMVELGLMWYVESGAESFLMTAPECTILKRLTSSPVCSAIAFRSTFSGASGSGGSVSCIRSLPHLHVTLICLLQGQKRPAKPVEADTSFRRARRTTPTATTRPPDGSSKP